MRMMRVYGALLLAFTLARGAAAADRGAWMIDTVSLNVMALDDVDAIGGSLWGETAVARERNQRDWSLLFGFGYDEFSPDNARNIAAWTIGIGPKLYLSDLTSLSAVGTYTRFQQEEDVPDSDVKAATLTLMQRLAPSEASVSPFLKGAMTWRERSTFSQLDPPVEDEAFSELLVTLSGGAEFRMADNWSFLLEVGYVEADTSESGAEDLDGPVGSVAMRYYWFKPTRY